MTTIPVTQADREAAAVPVNLSPYALSIPDGMVWTYQAVIRGGHLTHLWSLANEDGGIHISAVISEFRGGREWMGGCETHYANCPDYMDPEKPSHQHCWVLGAPCWHDGSSLYFSEHVAPMLPNPWESDPHNMAAHHHDRVLSELRYLHRIRFSKTEDTDNG